MTKFIHADIAAKFAEVAQQREDPWLEFESKHPNGKWIRCTFPPAFDEGTQYRHNPEPRRIVGVPRHFPAPLTELPEGECAVVYIADPTHDAWCYRVSADNGISPRHIDRQLAHKTRENAIEAAKAMVQMIGGKAEP